MIEYNTWFKKRKDGVYFDGLEYNEQNLGCLGRREA